MQKEISTGKEIYDLVCGDLELEGILLPDGSTVTSEFEDGSFCAGAYEEMLRAYSRLCDRLGTEEWADEDVETVITQLRRIQKYIALRMFDYGIALSHRQ